MTDLSIDWFSAGIDSIPADDEWLDPRLAERLATMTFAKRHSESRLGRWTAKVAIARSLELPTDSQILRSIVIHNAPDGAPEAMVDSRPFAGVIAMTDRADWAVSAVSATSMRVGCDLELVERRTSAFVSDYFTAAEQRAVAQSGEEDVVANAIWSAKESALKVLRTGLRRDTRTVEVHLEGTSSREWQALQVVEETGKVFPGWWVRFGSFILTCATEHPTSAPASLEDPPALATARPSHGWMKQMIT